MDANDFTDEATKVAGDVADKATSVFRTLASLLGRLFKALSQLLTVLPAVPSKVLATFATLLLRAGQASAESAGIEPPVVEPRSRGRRRAALWFLGGFTAGGAAGYAAAQYQAQREQGPPAQLMTMPDRNDGTGATG